MEYKAKTIHFQLPIIALPFLFSDRISTLLATCVRQPGVSLGNDRFFKSQLGSFL
ncbi:hypothetical protein [Pleurocapsa sp. FMAR1]|uniref:hypothetical protein n=1 Tax=Pleurocapsa sp. FMAR1 TaxID=3040204 RepID=UPI0029C91865|nr:hypothetical protein [Pleurocapsa sp. FMAR1]